MSFKEIYNLQNFYRVFTVSYFMEFFYYIFFNAMPKIYTSGPIWGISRIIFMIIVMCPLFTGLDKLFLKKNK